MKLDISPKECIVSYGTDNRFDMGRKTIDDGFFDEVLRQGTYFYKVENPYYETYTGTYVLNSSSSEQKINLHPAYGMLRIESEPSGADIYLDGAAQPIGRTPYTTNRLLKGMHRIQLYKEDYYGYSTEYEVFPDGAETIVPTIQLKPQFGWVTCQCEDTEALLTVTDAAGNVMGKGKTGLQLKLNSKGNYKLESSKLSHASQSVEIQGGTNIEGKNSMVLVGVPLPLYGLLEISTEPTRADVFIDGKKMGTSTFLGKILVGEHSVELQKEGYQPMKLSVNIGKDECVVLNQTLKVGPLTKRITLTTLNGYLKLDGEVLTYSQSWTGELEIGRKFKVTSHAREANYKEGELEITITENGLSCFNVPAPSFMGGELTIQSKGYYVVAIQTNDGNSVKSVSIPRSNIQMPIGRYVATIRGNDQRKECKRSFSIKQGKKTVITMNPTEKQSKNREPEPILVRIPTFLDLGTMNGSFSYGLGTGLGVGGYNNLFNMDLLLSLLVVDSTVGFKLTAYPSFNIFKTQNYYNKTVHLNIGPYYEYNGLSSFFGIRLGFGWHFSDFSVGFSYGTKDIFAFDFRMRVNMHLFRV